MARKTLTERREEKLAQLDTLKREIAHMEELAAKRLGKIALRAGLAELDIEDAALLKEFQAIAARFRGGAKVKAGEAAPAHRANGTGAEAHRHA
jgi:hypothetical protein